MSVSEPSKILTPWATSGLKNTIPQTANPVTGNAGYDQGFPAINMTAKEAGGIPPFGQDFNGIFFCITQILQYMQAGGLPTYSAAMSTAIGGYPLGAMLLKANGLGLWRNVSANNTSNPDSGGSGWVSESAGNYANATVIAATSTTLTAVQAGQAFLFSTASSTCQLPTAASVPAGEIFKIETASGLTLSVSGGGAMQVGNASLTSLVLPAGTEVTAVCTGSMYWVFGTGTISNSALYTGSKEDSGWRRTPDGFIEQWGVTGFITDGAPGVVVTLPVSFPSKNLGGFGNVLTMAGTGQSTEIQVLATSNSRITVGYNATVAALSAVSWRVWGY